MRNLLRGKGFCSFLLISVLFIFMASWAEGATTWITETVDSEGDVGKNASIAVDSRDNVHISYYDATNKDLKYATNASGSWVTETVDGSGDVVRYIFSIAIDSSDNVYIIYRMHDIYIDDLKYATNASGSWVIKTIESIVETEDSGGGVRYASIAIDSSDNVHISYSREDWYWDWSGSWYRDSALKYATNVSGSWATRVIEMTTSEYAGIGRTSIALDSSGNVHIGYHASYSHYAYSDRINYATNASGSWTRESVVGPVVSLGSIAVDSGDNVYISYAGNPFYGATPELKYTTNASGSWVAETVDSEGDVGRGSSIALDSGDNIHISYFDRTNGALKYATDASGLWVTETVDSSGYVGGRRSIALDSRDNVHISYYDYTNHDLKYAANSQKRRGRR